MKLFKSELEVIVIEEMIDTYKERLKLKELQSNSRKDLRREITRLNKIIKNLEDKLQYYKGMTRIRCSKMGMMDLQAYLNLQKQFEKAKNP